MCGSVYLCSSRGGGNLELSTQEFRWVEKGNKKCYIGDIVHHYKNKKGFTLAEVLITLGIIGIVAAMTMPPLIANHQKQAAVAAVKKAYSILNQALNMSLQEYEIDMIPYENWASEPNLFMEKYMNKYLSIAGVCNSQEECYGDDSIYYLKGDEIYNKIKYVVKLADGSYLGVEGVGNGGVYFWYDYNGRKRPNTVGKDIFLYYYYPTILALEPDKDPEVQSLFKTPSKDTIYAGFNGYTPGSALTRERILNKAAGHYGCNKVSYSSYSGSMCSTLILLDGKISKDYPW